VAVLVLAPAVPDSPVVFEAVGGVNTIRFGVLKFGFSRLIAVSFTQMEPQESFSRKIKPLAYPDLIPRDRLITGLLWTL